MPAPRPIPPPASSEKRAIRIAAPGDERVAVYTAIRERDLTGREGRFIAEGKVTLEVLLRRGRFAVESVFVAESRLAPLSGLLEGVPANVPLYTAPQDMMDQMAGFALHRGVLACGLKGAPLGLEAVLCEARTVVVAIGLSNHDNVGALFRNSAAFGADAVLMDAATCDPLYRKAIRVSAGTALWLPYVRSGTGASLVEAVRVAGFEAWALTPRADAPGLYGLQRPERLALLVGAEGPGLPPALIDAARPVRIPMADGVDSLNVATAAAIALSWACAIG